MSLTGDAVRPFEDQRAAGTAAGPDEVHLSVVIAARDAESTLGAQLEALARQQAPFRWEVIVADNGSTDGTAQLVRSMVGRVPGLRLLDASARPGAAAARNIGVGAARGRHVAFCDADDIVAHRWVAGVGAALRTSAFVAGALEWGRLNDPVTRRSRVADAVTHLNPSPWAPHLLRVGACNMAMRTAVFRHVGGFCEDAPSMEDIDLGWRVQLAGIPVVFLPDAVVHYRLRRGARAIARQAYAYGTGERWLAQRYRLMSALGTDHEAEPRRPSSRVLGRAAHLGRQVAGVRGRGDLARLSAEVAFGLGYAFGEVVDQAPLEPAMVTGASAPAGDGAPQTILRPDENRMRA